MHTANLSDVKDHLSRYIRRVRDGDRIRILVRGVPVADLVPIERPAQEEDELEDHLKRLERKGWIRRGSGRADPELLEPPPRAEGGKPLTEYVLDERREGR